MKAKRDVVLLRNTLIHFGIVDEENKDLLILLCQDEDLLEYIRLTYDSQGGSEKARRGVAVLPAEEVLFLVDFVDTVKQIFYQSSKQGINLSLARTETLKFIREFGSASWALCSAAERLIVVREWLAFRAGESVSVQSEGDRKIANALFVYATNLRDGTFRMFPASWWRKYRETNGNVGAYDSSLIH
jgi:hypothetical protein